MRILAVRGAFRIVSRGVADLSSWVEDWQATWRGDMGASARGAIVPNGDPALRYVQRVEELFRSQATEALTLAGAAARAGCSVRALQLAFRRCRDMTPMAALRLIRLEAARTALAGADAPTSIRTIAGAYRFTNTGRFARLFKEAFGQFPSEFRRDRSHSQSAPRSPHSSAVPWR
jgi:transcriptional regulator GlxA family with amidase domain